MNVEPFSIGLRDPLGSADETIEDRSGHLIRGEHRGHSGVGEATPLRGWTESLDECEHALEAAASIASNDGLAEALRELPGDAPAARHGVSTALLDADARAEGTPLYRWFDDARSVERVPVNATIGDAEPDRTVESARDAVDAGFDCLKVKVGARPIGEDVERLHAIRDAVGDGPTLRVDANGAWTRDEASAILDDLASLDVDYVEQPLDPADLEGHGTLRAGPVSVALDESIVERGIDGVLDADAADALVLKPMALGGPGEAYAIATRCREEGIEPVVSTTVDAVVARTAAVHVAAAIPDVAPCGLATADRLESDLGPDPAPVEDGEMTVPQGPGLGVEEVSARG